MLLQLIRKLRGPMAQALVPSWVEKLQFESACGSCVKAVRKNVKTDLGLRPLHCNFTKQKAIS